MSENSGSDLEAGPESAPAPVAETPPRRRVLGRSLEALRTLCNGSLVLRLSAVEGQAAAIEQARERNEAEAAELRRIAEHLLLAQADLRREWQFLLQATNDLRNDQQGEREWQVGLANAYEDLRARLVELNFRLQALEDETGAEPVEPGRKPPAVSERS